MARKTAAALTSPTDKAIYVIAERAPPYIAGERVGDRKEIELTEHQARAELLAGHILPKPVASDA
ncbi:hypothetical protein [Rhizobium sp. BK377]|uniref:hypothetical protein n=1 Tax=Rhizobium sp. BK377 TaxID=2587058 RepID=UPI00161113E1|nr:hypothetical protein [Rhizobium sp. BK377]MBB3461978.1 hypothetical protein [Rhizobium sp. BK377]